MIPMPLTWTLLTLSLWASGWSQLFQQEIVNDLYPEILSNAAIECACVNISCDSVYWFRTMPNGKVQYLCNCNIADRCYCGDGVDEARFKSSSKGGVSFTLRIIGVTEQDAGIYSCVLKAKKDSKEVWKPGTRLWPGVAAPTLPPKKKANPPLNPVCRCPKKSSQVGCGSLVLWPLVGVLSALALALISTLYYFSRLPKKCRHHFVKKR